jgi:hypothetical protein
MYTGCTQSHKHIYFILKQRFMYKNRYCFELLEVLSLFHEIPKMIQAILPPVHELEYATMVEVCFSI